MRFSDHRSLHPLHRFSLSLLLTFSVANWDRHQLSLSPDSITLTQAIIFIPAAITPQATQLAQVSAQVTRAEQALLDAVAAGHLGDVKAALERGASPDAGDLYSGYALTNAATLGYKEIVQLLLARGATVDIASDEGYRPLIEAIAANQPEIVQILLEQGADPNRVAAGLTPLEFAIQANSAAIVKLLLAAKASVPPADGRDLLAVAQQQGNAEIIALIRAARR